MWHNWTIYKGIFTGYNFVSYQINYMKLELHSYNLSSRYVLLAIAIAFSTKAFFQTIAFFKMYSYMAVHPTKVLLLIMAVHPN